MSHSRIAVVTGANKGIGFAIARNLALEYPKSSFNNGSLLIYLTARNKERGEEALKALHSDSQLKNAKSLAEDGGLSEVTFHELDINQTKSIQTFRDHLQEKHPKGIDFVINNAGLAMTGFDYNVAKETIQCNYYGTLEATQDFLSLIKDGGRLVNVASSSGALSRYPNTIRSKFLGATTVGEITSLMEDFKTSVQDNTYQRKGWPEAAYAVSKAGCIGMTKAIAHEAKETGSKTLINVCCPGWVVTDMTKGKGHKTADEGAKTPVMLALGDIGGVSGEFWRDEQQTDW